MTPLGRKGKECWRSGRSVLALAVLAFGPLAPAVVGQRVLLPADLLMVMVPFKAYQRQLGFRRVSNPILDAVQQFWPWRQYAGQQLRRGIIPLWNPYLFCGTPFVANNQSAVFYPETWLFAWLPAERAFGWAAALYLFASGSFMFWFLRRLGLRRRAALVGAVAWMYNGFVVGWICLPSFRSVPGWLPLLLGAYEEALRRRPGQAGPWLALAALAVAMQFWAGNLHISFFVLLTFALYAAWAAGRERYGGRGAARPLAAAATILALGSALAALQLMPTLELAHRSPRTAITYADLLSYRLVPLQLWVGLMPDVLGHPADYNHWGGFLGQQYRSYTELAWYTGGFTAVLAVLALLRAWRRQVYFWAAVAVIGLALALGLPLNLVFFKLVPGFRMLPGINRAVVMTCFALPVLASFGAQTLLEAERPLAAAGPRKGRLGRWAAEQALGASAAAVAGVALVGTLWAWVVSGRYEAAGLCLGSYTGWQYARWLAVAGLPTLLAWAWRRWRRPGWWAAALAVLAADMGYFALHFFPLVSRKYCQPPSQMVAFLQEEERKALSSGQPFRILSIGRHALDRMAPNVPMLFGLQDVQGSESLAYGRYVRLLKAACDARYGFEQVGWDSALAGLAGARYLLSAVELRAARGQVPPYLVEVMGGERAKLYERRGTWPRAYLAELALVSASAQETLALLRGCFSAPARVVISPADREKLRGARWVGRAGRQRAALRRLSAAPQPTLQCIPYQASWVRVQARGGLHRGDLLVLMDSYYPGWRAYGQHGEPLTLIPANYCFRAVALEREARWVDFVYEPASYKLGSFVALGAVVVLGALLVGASKEAGYRSG
jgi:hypothetical protein